MAEKTAAVRVSEPYAEAAATIKELQRSGFDMNNLSIVGKDYHTEAQVMGYRSAGDLKKVWCQLGKFWGGLSGLLFGSCFIVVPAIGPVIVFGPLVRWIVRALEGAIVGDGMSALGAGLYTIGMSKNDIMECETALKTDKFLVITHRTADMGPRAKPSVRRPVQHKSPPMGG